MQRARSTAGLLMAVFCVLASAPAFAIASPPDATTEAATAVSYEEATLKGSVNPLGASTSYWFEYGETTSYGTKIPASPKSVGSGTSNLLVSNLVTGLKESTTYHFRVVAESKEGSTNGEDATFTTDGYLFSFGEKGSGNGQLSEPFGIAVDSKGNIWISDMGNNRIEEFDAEGKYLFQFGKKGTGNGEFESPKGIAIDPTDRIWVVDSGNHRIQEFDTEGKFLRKAGEEGAGEGQLKSPTGITIEHSGERPWVADTGNDRIVKFNKEGKYLNQFGKKGTGDGELMSPEGVLSDAKARLWVVDTGNNRVQRFSASSFAFVSKFCEEGTGNGHCKAPIGIAADFQEKLWVADSGNDRSQKFNIGGDYLDKVGVEGTGSGQLMHPTAVVAPSPQKLLILDSGNDRVESWTVKAEPPTATTGVATGVKAASATVPATINPVSLATTYWFEYGETTSYGTKIPISPESVGSGLTGVSVEQTITGLKENTKYNFRVVAENSAGMSTGINRTFKTLKLPKVVTESATAIKITQASLNGKVNPEGFATTYWFEYGETTSYGTKIPVSPESVGSGTEYVSVSQTPSGLKGGTTYHFRVVAESEAGKVIGEDKFFTTLKLPDVTTEPATAIKLTQATLHGKVNPLGLATTYWFEYGETTSYGTKIPVSPESVGSGTEYVSVSQTPSGLKSGTTYHFRVVAESEAGVSKGEDKAVTTVQNVVTEAVTAIGLTKATLNGKVNPEGFATTYWFEYGETTSYGTKIPISPESVGSGTEYVSVSQTPSGLKSGTTYHFRVVAESEAGISKGADRTFKTAPYFSLSFGTTGSGNGQFYLPAGIAIDSEGNVWVADYENSRIEKFSTAGKYLFQFGEEGEEEGQLLYPTDLAIDAEGDIWVTANSRIQEFSPEGEYLSGFGEWGEEEGQLGEPEGIAIDSEGDIWAVDTYNGRLQEFDSEGNLIQVVGSYGSEPGQLGEPTGIDVGPKGNVWVADWQNNRVSEFDEAGEFIRQFGAEGSGNGQFVGPDTIEVDESGTVWVVDEGNNRVQWFDEEGKYLGKFGTAGSGAGEFRFLRPTGIASDTKGNLWVSDSNVFPFFNHVQKWVR
jgi:sugar lactone lactonase YvrE